MRTEGNAFLNVGLTSVAGMFHVPTLQESASS